MLKALSASLTTNLLTFSRYLWQRNIAHKITEERGQQIIWVTEDNDVKLVRHYYEQWLAGSLSIPEPTINPVPEQQSSSVKRSALTKSVFKQWSRTPATSSILIISIIVTLLMNILPGNIILRWLMFIDPVTATRWIIQHGVAHTGSEAFNELTQVWLQTLLKGQWWRLITPIFLHFSILHIAFNAAMFFFFGQRVEAKHGVKTLLCLVVVTALLSNIVQYFSGNLNGIIFGGLSGVIYGLIGFCWVRARETHDGYGIPRGIYGFMIGWLILGYTGILDGLFGGALANGAHAGGLIAGMIAGFITAKKQVTKQ